MKVKKKIIILVSICIVVLIGAIITDRSVSKTYFNKIEFDDLIKKIENDETFIFVISQTTCTHCATYKPKLEQAANDYKLEIYYIDVDLLSDEENTKLKSYVSYEGTPVTIFLKDGEETSAITRINGDASREKIDRKLKSNGFVD